MQQLRLFDIEAVPVAPVAPAVIKVKTWELMYRGYRGAFSVIGQAIKKGKVEYDYQCDIFDPGNYWTTYIEITGASPKNVENDFRLCVDTQILKKEELENNALFIVDFIKSSSSDLPPTLPVEEICKHFDPIITASNRAKAINHAVHKGWLKVGDMPHDPFKYVVIETQCAEKADCGVLEQVNNETVPELSTKNVLQWVEVYTPSTRKKNSYYRYCFKLDGKISHSHIAGGSVKAPLSISRKEEIEQAIVKGMVPAQIKSIIAGWKINAS